MLGLSLNPAHLVHSLDAVISLGVMLYQQSKHMVVNWLQDPWSISIPAWVAFQRGVGPISYAPFAGVSLEASTLRPDEDGNEALCGSPISARRIVRGPVSEHPEAARIFKSIMENASLKSGISGLIAVSKKSKKGEEPGPAPPPFGAARLPEGSHFQTFFRPNRRESRSNLNLNPYTVLCIRTWILM